MVSRTTAITYLFLTSCISSCLENEFVHVSKFPQMTLTCTGAFGLVCYTGDFARGFKL